MYIKYECCRGTYLIRYVAVYFEFHGLLILESNFSSNVSKVVSIHVSGISSKAAFNFSAHSSEIAASSLCSYLFSNIWKEFFLYKTTSIGKSTLLELTRVESKERKPALRACFMDVSGFRIRLSMAFPCPEFPIIT